MTKLFGTDGIRGKTGTFPITEEDIFKVTLIYSTKFKLKNIAVAWDTRESSLWIANAVISAIKLSNKNAVLLGCIPTPVLSYIVGNNPLFDGGIMITASHNPYNHNGLKFFDKNGEKISDGLEKAIEEEFDNFDNTTHIENHIQDQLFINTEYLLEYFKGIKKHIKISAIKRTIPLDCANGACSLFIKTAQDFFNLDFKPYNIIPDGKNINKDCGAANPEHIKPESFAFDGDGDRIMGKDREENIINGDHILMFLSDFLKVKKLVGTVMTNSAVEVFCKERGIKFFRTPVGDRFVKEKMKETGAILGGETSGHTIFSPINKTGDGFAIYLKLIEILNTQSLYLEHISKNYPLFPQTVVNIKVNSKKPINRIKGFVPLIKELEKQLGDGRIFPRYSGTENILRILIESRDEKPLKFARKKIIEFFNKTEV